MEIDSLREQLGCIKNEMTHLWGTAFLFGGTSLMLLLRGVSDMERIIAIPGIIIALALFNAYFIRRDETLRIVNKIKEIKDEY